MHFFKLVFCKFERYYQFQNLRVVSVLHIILKWHSIKLLSTNSHLVPTSRHHYLWNVAVISQESFKIYLARKWSLSLLITFVNNGSFTGEVESLKSDWNLFLKMYTPCLSFQLSERHRAVGSEWRYQSSCCFLWILTSSYCFFFLF